MVQKGLALSVSSQYKSPSLLKYIVSPISFQSLSGVVRSFSVFNSSLAGAPVILIEMWQTLPGAQPSVMFGQDVGVFFIMPKLDLPSTELVFTLAVCGSITTEMSKHMGNAYRLHFAMAVFLSAGCWSFLIICYALPEGPNLRHCSTTEKDLPASFTLE
jgi:hypothetical protein